MRVRYIQGNFFAGQRLQMDKSIELTVESVMAYAPFYKHWCVAWSGGKDSTTLLTLIVWLISTGKIPKPESLTIIYADTRMELTPLWLAAQAIIDELKEMGFEVRIAMAPLEKRFLPYILGRGVPPPTNTFRWCTRQIKIDPMKAEVERLFSDRDEKILMLTGVRQGESAIRDKRIVMSCGKDGAECGQGWFQEGLPGETCDTLAPILHWRVCHVWEWLRHWAPLPEYGDFSTKMIADAYGGDEAEEVNARTGCIGCPLASKDKALDTIIKMVQYHYLLPLKRLKPLYRKLRLGSQRLRKTGKEKGARNRQRLGPLTMDARKMAFDEIMSIQNEINAKAILENKPTVVLLNEEEQAFIQQCWSDNIWPQGWDGDEPTGDTWMDQIFLDGTVQPLIRFGE